MSRDQCTRARAIIKPRYFGHFFSLFFLQLGHAIYQSIGRWGQDICFLCQTMDSSTLTDALVTSYFHVGHCRSIISCEISKHTYKGPRNSILRRKINFEHSDRRDRDQLIPCWSFQINFIM